MYISTNSKSHMWSITFLKGADSIWWRGMKKLEIAKGAYCCSATFLRIWRERCEETSKYYFMAWGSSWELFWLIIWTIMILSISCLHCFAQECVAGDAGGEAVRKFLFGSRSWFHFRYNHWLLTLTTAHYAPPLIFTTTNLNLNTTTALTTNTQHYPLPTATTHLFSMNTHTPDLTVPRFTLQAWPSPSL